MSEPEVRPEYPHSILERCTPTNNINTVRPLAIGVEALSKAVNGSRLEARKRQGEAENCHTHQEEGDL
jgi:hypothetical protein